LIDKNDFAGVDIDYEGKDMADRDAFSNFIIELSAAVRNKGYLLYCTIEPRTTDAPPPGWKGTTAMAWADDYHVLNKYCDKVRIMAYDQFVQTKGGKIWKDTVQQPFVPNADINWVEEVLKYSLQSISPHKIFLGVPTYSWEFTMSGKPGNWEYQSMQSLSYSQALELAHSKKTSPLRNPDGELYFAYEDNGVRHLVSVSDSQSMRAKIELAQKYGIYGIVFFKMDGLVDNGLWDVMNAK
jgi:spore germination protein YaaH